MHNAFKAIVNTLMLWLVLLALPLQGMAAVMPHCAPPSSAMTEACDGHDAQRVQHAHADSDHHPAKAAGTHDDCAAACCLGALPPTSLGLPAQPATSQPVAGRCCHMAGIVHAPPEHPPQDLPA